MTRIDPGVAAGQRRKRRGRAAFALAIFLLFVGTAFVAIIDNAVGGAATIAAALVLLALLAVCIVLALIGLWPAPKPEPLVCTACGATSWEGEEVCVRCGEPLLGEPRAAP